MPDFLKNAPRHIDFMQHAPRPPRHQEPVQQSQRKPAQNLLDFYLMGDYSALYRDAEHRPKHYDEKQHRLIEDLKRGKRPTDQEMDQLMYRYTERTEQAKKRSELIRRAQTPKKKASGPSFESQDYGKLIRVI